MPHRHLAGSRDDQSLSRAESAPSSHAIAALDRFDGHAEFLRDLPERVSASHFVARTPSRAALGRTFGGFSARSSALGFGDEEGLAGTQAFATTHAVGCTDSLDRHTVTLGDGP